MNELDQYKIAEEPFYQPQDDEIEMYTAAYMNRMPVMLKGPTGCGKSRFVEYMAYKLDKPLITVACNEDMSASDLVGRFLLDKEGTIWQDGPLAMAIAKGPSCQIVPSLSSRKRPTRSLADISSLQATVINGLSNLYAIYSTNRDLPHPVGPFNITGIRFI